MNIGWNRALREPSKVFADGKGHREGSHILISGNCGYCFHSVGKAHRGCRNHRSLGTCPDLSRLCHRVVKDWLGTA
jgi:hypothetical protein